MRKRYARAAVFTSSLLLSLLAGNAAAAPSLRVQVDQRGDFVLFGNTLGYECNNPVPPVVGSVGACGLNTADSAPDIFWRSDSPADGQAEANPSITPQTARSTAMLQIPPSATITHAFLYWAAKSISGPGLGVTLERPGGLSADIGAESSATMNDRYQSMANVTSFVQANGPGAYRVSGVSSNLLVNVNDANNFAGWWMVVFYALDSDPMRDLTLFDGLDGVISESPLDVTLSGFTVPGGSFDAKLGVVAYDGDDVSAGDKLFFNGAQLSDALNPANNFFNGTRSTFGAGTHLAGDLPEMPGTARSLAGLDLDVVDITSNLAPAQSSAPVQVLTDGDVIFVGGFVTSITTLAPNFSGSTKTAEDMNGAPLLPGDDVEYTIAIVNTGNEGSTGTEVLDPLPAGVSFVPGSLQISQGATSIPVTDASGDDQGEYDAASRTISVRLGAGADMSQGGAMAMGESASVTFHVTINPGHLGAIDNQAFITAAGAHGAAPSTTPTRHSAADPAPSPTSIFVDQCGSDADCPAPSVICDALASPRLCVQCLEDDDCPGSSGTCDSETHQCTCVATGEEVCDGEDNDCDGVADNGFALGLPCEVGAGQCRASGVIVCGSEGDAQCNAVPAQPKAERCDGEDNDCDGIVDNGLGLGLPCEVGAGKCHATGVLVCGSEGDAMCNAVSGQPQAETCDGEDNDCDGIVDNGFALGQACQAGAGECRAAGVLVCNAQGGMTCNAVPGQPQAETCDGKDNDCDGIVDNGFALGQACQAGVGECRAAGVLVCNAQGGVMCNAKPGQPHAERCDGKDNDCDGAVDNGLHLGEACDAGLGECRQSGVLVCDPRSAAATCSATPGKPSREVCDGKDNNCNGKVDEAAECKPHPQPLTQVQQEPRPARRRGSP